MKIITAFPGGNAEVLSIDGDTVYLKPELRDTPHDWFYWCFAVEGAQGRTVTFQFDSKIRVGYYGAAVSHDLRDWHWQLTEDVNPPDRFTYTFGEDEDLVYFAHDMVYRPERLFALLDELSITPETLCRSRRGRDIPFFSLGRGDRYLLLTARQHACESTGSYVLEGAIRRLAKHPIEGYTVLVVPMVDFDGVIDGDQGKGRAPHDHNRDYVRGEEAIYPETKAIKAFIDRHDVVFGIDYHSPYHVGTEHDRTYICVKDVGKHDLIKRYSACLEAAMTPDAMAYRAEYDVSTRNSAWMRNDTPDLMGYIMDTREDAVALALETTYFGRPVAFSPERAVALGACSIEAARVFLKK